MIQGGVMEFWTQQSAKRIAQSDKMQCDMLSELCIQHSL